MSAGFRHASGNGCSLVTTLDGPIYAEADTGFKLLYTLRLEFIGDAPCDSTGCAAFVTFEGTRRPDTRLRALAPGGCASSSSTIG